MSLCSSCGADAGEVARFCPSCGAVVARVQQNGDPMVGRVIAGKFRVDALLGEGGMGMVYKATQVNLDKTIVLKVLRPSLVSDERTVQRFQREARAASRLNHPNSIAVIDFGQAPDDGSMYIAMEYCPGHDLHHILSHEWPLDEGRIIRVMTQVLGALVEAHANGVIHRDLKPENIMIEQRRGEPDFVKVLDFGIAKITDTAGDEGQALTRAGFVCGTPEYMSPEQARGAQIDHRSDLYAIGVILYQLVTGMLPFDSESAVGFATAHLTQEVPPIRKRRPEARCSPGLERLIMRALAKDANARPQSAEAFRAELLGLVPGAPTATEATDQLTAPGTDSTQITRAVSRRQPRLPTPAPEEPWADQTPAAPAPPAVVQSRGRIPVGRASDPTRLEPTSSTDTTPAAPRSMPTGRPPQASGSVEPPSSASRIAVAVTALGLLGATGFFVYEMFLKKPAEVTPVVKPIDTPPVTAQVDPPKPDPVPSATSTGSTGGAPQDEVNLTETTMDPGQALKRSESELKNNNVVAAVKYARMAYDSDHDNVAAMKLLANSLVQAERMHQTAHADHDLAIDLYTKLLQRKESNDDERKFYSRQIKALSALR